MTRFPINSMRLHVKGLRETMTIKTPLVGMEMHRGAFQSNKESQMSSSGGFTDRIFSVTQ